MSESKISVLLPVSNEEPYLTQCLDSILFQEGAQLEICISDNASSDKSWDIISAYHRRFNNVIAFQQLAQVHPLDNLKQTLKMATGDLVYLMGGDDYLLPNFFREALHYFRKCPDLTCYLQRMIYFDDTTGASLGPPLPPLHFEYCINLANNADLINFMLSNYNHDELVLGVFNITSINSVIYWLANLSFESGGWWLFLGVALCAKEERLRIKIADQPYLMKRYNKLTGHNNKFSKDSQRNFAIIGPSSRKEWGSVQNSWWFFKNRLISGRLLLVLLFRSRVHGQSGRLTPGPIPSLLLKAPKWILRQVRRAFRIIFEFLR